MSPLVTTRGTRSTVTMTTALRPHGMALTSLSATTAALTAAFCQARRRLFNTSRGSSAGYVRQPVFLYSA